MAKKAEVLKAIVKKEIEITELPLKLKDFPDKRTNFDGSELYAQFEQLVTEELKLQVDLDALCGGHGKGARPAFLAQELASAIIEPSLSCVILNQRQEKLKSKRGQIRRNLGLD